MNFIKSQIVKLYNKREKTVYIYVKECDKETAERYLADKPLYAAVLRLSRSHSSDSTLTIRTSDCIQHFHIYCENEKYYFSDDKKYNSVPLLIDEYSKNNWDQLIRSNVWHKSSLDISSTKHFQALQDVQLFTGTKREGTPYFEYRKDHHRERAEKYLSDRSNYSFVVRPSVSYYGCDVLTIKTPSGIRHILIFQKGTRYYFSEDRMFSSLHSLLEEYSRNNWKQLLGSSIRVEESFVPEVRTSTTNTMVINQHNYFPELKVAIDANNRMQEHFQEICRIPMADIEIQTDVTLGLGCFGTVFLGKWKQRNVAVKCSKSIIKHVVVDEITIMNKLQHDNIVKFFGIVEEVDNIKIIMEHINNGSLQKFLKSNLGKALTTAELINIGCGVASGMEYLASKCIIHRDLALRNVLLEDLNKAKISDFGLAKILESPDDIYKLDPEAKQPIKWCALEVVRDYIYTLKSDVWAYGIFLMELFTYGRDPYESIKQVDVKKKIIEGYRMSQPNDVAEELYETLKSCWRDTPSSRPTYDDLKKQLRRYIFIKQDKIILENEDHKIFHGTWNSKEVTVEERKVATTTSELREIRMMTKLHHKNLIKVYEIFRYDDTLRVLMEFAPYPDLKSLLTAAIFNSYDLKQIALQVSLAMQYLEQEGIVHRNLSAKQILINRKGDTINVKLAGFINAQYQCGSVIDADIVTPVRYAAYETFTESKYSTKSDVWLYGIFLLELFTSGEIPYNDLAEEDVKSFVLVGGIARKPDNFPDDIYDLARRCWIRNPCERPTFEFLTNSLVDLVVLS